MSSTFGIFESAKSGLSVAMQQLNVTEQNIANVNTEGYTRQRILTSAKEPPISKYLIAQLSKTAVGQGVEATGLQQLRSDYLDQQYRNLNSSANSSSSRNEALTYLTGVLNELKTDSSLTKSIDKFFSALNTFAGDTSSKEFRTNVQQQALSMTQSFNNVYEEMQSLWHDQNDSINIVTQKINSIAQEIAQLNDSIAGALQTGGTANDLNDERNLLLDQLSGYVDITYSLNANNNNMIDVQIGGLSLIEGKTANTITVDSMADNPAYTTTINSLLDDIATRNAADPADPQLLTDFDMLKQYGDFSIAQGTDPANPLQWTVRIGDVELVTSTGSAKTMSFEDAADIDMTAWVEFNRNRLTLDDPATVGDIETLEIGAGGAVTGGQLYSNMEMITSKSALSPGIPYYMNQLNTFVKEMAQNLNGINESGYTYPDGTTLSQTGVSFFNVPLTAGDFSLSAALLDSVYNIAGSSEPVNLSGNPTNTGNNVIALKLAQDLTNSGYKDKLHSIVVNLGIVANSSKSIMDTKQSLRTSVDTQRRSLSSVSLDEETTNLIIFQQSYNAAARIITTIDEMLNVMINNMGIVGR